LDNPHIFTSPKASSRDEGSLTTRALLCIISLQQNHSEQDQETWCTKIVAFHYSDKSTGDHQKSEPFTYCVKKRWGRYGHTDTQWTVQRIPKPRDLRSRTTVKWPRW